MFTRREGERLVCQTCRDLCRLEEGEEGRCGLRRREEEDVLLKARIRMAEVEPVERRGFFHVAPATAALVYWIESAETPATDLTFPEHTAVVAMGDPEVAWAFEIHAEIARRARESGRKVLWNTRGMWTSPVLGLVPSLADGIRVILDRENQDRWEKILYEAAWLRKRGVWVEVALFPGATPFPRKVLMQFLQAFTESVSPQTPLHIVRTFSPRTPAAPLIHMAEQLATALPYVYVDFLPGNPREMTLCPHCEAPLIYRFGWMILENRIRQGRCPECLHPLPGLWTL